MPPRAVLPSIRFGLFACLAQLAFLFVAPAAQGGAIPVVAVQQDADGATLTMSPGKLNLKVCTDGIIRVMYSPGSTLPTGQGFAANQAAWPSAPFQLTNGSTSVTLATAKVQVVVDKTTGSIQFLDTSNGVLLQEISGGGKTMTAVTVNGESSYRPEQTFTSPADEFLYGLGQYQEGIWNWRGMPQQLRQVNTQIAMPVIVSNKGYGLFWNNASLSEFNPADSQVTIDPTAKTGTYTTGAAGEYAFIVKDGDRNNDIGVAVNSQTVARITNRWVPYTIAGKITLPAGTTVPVQLFGGGSNAKVYARPLGNTTTFRSEIGDAIDYYFFYGPKVDQIVAGFRQATGAVPLFPKTAYGFWQCRERYSSQQQILDAAAGFRSRNIPVDFIIQDWQYWGSHGWGAYEWNETSYPDPATMISQLHTQNFKYMISVWSDPEGIVGNALANMPQGRLPGTTWMDIFNPAVRSLRWSYMNSAFFSIGTDGWWQDSTEPGDDGNSVSGKQCYAGNANRVRNSYPLFATQATYEGQRAQDPGKRVVILSRSAYPGIQRYAGAVWSGDINGDWITFSRQIPAGLNYTITGSPYWTTDTSGFFHPGSQYTSTDFNELLTRWFQWSTFCPILRIHGYQTATEMWNWLPQTQTTLLAYDTLRYRMLPYNYSWAWMTTSAGYTPMRALVMDFPNDPNVLPISNQYMFGPAFLACPVTTAQATTRSVYLPSGTSWVDFWNGEKYDGGQTIIANAPISIMPLFVRAGSIVPFGPALQYATEKAPDPIELRVYPGADGDFTLYEDAGDSYDYESGSYATIPFHWDNAGKTLTIGARQGSFAGMLTSRTFKVVWVYPGHGVGAPADAAGDVTVTYSGSATSVPMPGGATPPNAPTDVAATPGVGQISLAWTAPSGAATYLIKRAIGSGNPYYTIAAVNTPGYVDTSLSTANTYFYQVIAANSAGQSTASAPVSATPTGEVPINGWFSGDIGAVGISGSTTLVNGAYSMVASGVDITGTSDSFRFARRDFSGDGVLLAKVTSLQNSDSWAKAGVMFRATEDANSAHASMFVTPGHGVTFQWRTSAGSNAASNFTTASGSAPIWVKLVRSGNTFTGYSSTDGITWTSRGSATITMPSAVKAGLAVTSHNNGVSTTAVIGPVGLFPSSVWSANDIGAVTAAGSSVAESGVFTLQASGSDISGTADQFHFASQSWTGDGAFVARVTGETRTDLWTKAGIMVRSSLSDAGTVNCLIALTPGNGATFQWRPTAGATTSWNATGSPSVPYWIRLTRVGNVFTAYHSPNGVIWTQQGTPQTLSIPSTCYVGFALTAHTSGSDIATATFDNVSFGAVPPNAPTNLAATPVSESQIQLTWTDAATDETRYVVDISPANTQGWNNAAILPAGSTGVLVSNLSASFAYDFRVRAENTLASDYAAITQSTPAGIGDGIPGWWRYQYFGNGLSLTPTSAYGANPDGDDLTNAQEYAAGTNPTTSSSTLKITQLQASGNDMLISFPSVTGKPYRLERSDTLQSGSWTTVQDNIVGTGNTVQVPDAGGALQSKRFYRIVIP